MNGRIDLKDGFCVSCGLESGVLYHSCPFCDEMVWHPLWRRVLCWYITFILPLGVIFLLLLNYHFAVDALRAYAAGRWQFQILIAVSAGLIFSPCENYNLICPSSRSRIFWLLNSLAASTVLILVALLFVVTLCFSDSSYAMQSLCCIMALSGLLVPLVLNCNWWRLLPAVLFVIGFVAV